MKMSPEKKHIHKKDIHIHMLSLSSFPSTAVYNYICVLRDLPLRICRIFYFVVWLAGILAAVASYCISLKLCKLVEISISS